MIGNDSDCGYDCHSISIYEILIVACSVHGLPRRLMQWRAAATAPPTSGCELCPRPVPATATAVQSKRSGSTYRHTARGNRSSFTSSNSSRANEGRKGRLSVRNSRAWQASPGRESLFTWQIYRCGRLPSGNGGKGSVHG